MVSISQEERQTGLRIVFDDRSRDYPVRSLLAPVAATSKKWNCYTRLDQGQEPECVGFAWSHEAAADPVSVSNVTNALGRAIYKRAQQIDEWPGENYAGTSILAGAKTAVELNLLEEYRWIFGIQDLIDSLSQLGPIVAGIPWYNSMFNPTPEGRMIVDGIAPSGHAFIWDELDLQRGIIWMLNNWNKTWGVDGRAFCSIEDWEKILKQGGQGINPVKRKNPTPVPDPVPPVPPTKIPHYIRGIRYDEMSDGSIWTSTFKYDTP